MNENAGRARPHKYCLRCGYILDGLPEPRCPECGREFDPVDPETFRWSFVPTGRSHLHWMLAGISLLVLPIVVAAFRRGLARHDPVTWPVCALAATLGYFVTVGVAFSSGLSLSEAHWPRHPLLLRSVFIVSLLLTLFGCCPGSVLYGFLIGAPLLD